MPSRKVIYTENYRVRQGISPRPRRLDDGEVTFRIFEADFFALRKLYPELAACDGKTRFEAWKRFAASPFSEPFRVTRNARAVKASDKRIIVK
jgi:hypothetical protein